ncbi:MAG TPA: UMP kinase [Candidatus Paceibacterota bacterium]
MINMKHKFGQVIVIGLGGSIIYPDHLDIKFLSDFKKCIDGFVRRGMKFIIVAGGGRVSRIYQEAASKITDVSDEDKDWLGIHATRSNAQLLRTIFHKNADPVVIDTRRKIKKLKYPITIASGWRPGWSTDFVALQLAHDFRVREIIVAGKPSHVFDKDFVKYKNAKPFTEISWKNYRKLIPAKWRPGFHSPVDPVAARLAQSACISAIVINGKDLKNFSNLLREKNFAGTIIS